jgi:hypothetical protein
MISDTDIEWFQMVICDPKCLSGKSVNLFLKDIFYELKIEWAITSDVIGDIRSLQDKLGKPIMAAELLNAIEISNQYDWAFFFLYSERPNIVTLNENVEDIILSSDATVRLVDSGYFYLYTHNKNLINKLIVKYPNANVEKKDIKYLDIPY